MANTGLTNFSQHGILPVWPFLGREGFLVPPTQPSDGKGLPTLQRTKPPRRVVDFSIRSILALDGTEVDRENCNEKPARDAVGCAGAPHGHTWICCTRFRPPSIPKTKQLGSPRLTSRSPRVPFSATQQRALESSFQHTRYLSTGQVREVALLLGLTENRVKIWFQNRRAREKRDLLKQHQYSHVGVNSNPVEDHSPLGWH